MVSVAFAREAVSADLLTEALPLLTQHWKEIATYADIPLVVDTPAYLAAGEAGVVRCFTVRVPEERVRRVGALLGYALFFVRSHMHYTGSVQAVQDVLYLHPSVRGGTGAEFIAWCDDQLRGEGVQVVHHHAKIAHPQLGIALERLGYEPVETIYSRRLDLPTDVEREHVQAMATGTQRAPWLPKDVVAHAEALGRAAGVDPVQFTGLPPRGSYATSELIDFADLMRETAGMVCDEDGG